MVLKLTMADVNEDTPVNQLSHPGSQNPEDPDQEDDAPDYRFLSSIVKGKNQGKVLKRGEKDFEPHGTKHQEGVLEGSREAMREVLGFMRMHIGKGWVRGFWFGDEMDEGCDGEIDEGMEEMRKRMREERGGLGDDHVVYVERPKGSWFRCMGQSTTGRKESRLWLLPEEALYLVERGNLDLWWPGRDALRRGRSVEVAEDEEQDNGGKEEGEAGDEGSAVSDAANEELNEGLPMSLQAAYAVLIGQNGEMGKISLEKYAVFANLKRAGYVVMRATDSDLTHTQQTTQPAPPTESIFVRLFGSFFSKEEHHPPLPYCPLVKPGLYRSYIPIYRQLSIIPRHQPSATPSHPAPPPIDPFRVHYHLWKPTRIPTFAKSNPGEPDFRICVVDARDSSVPTLMQITSLLESTPWDPPPKELQGKMYQKLRHGWRNVVIAVNDQGVISYLRVVEGGFGEERLFEGFGRARGRGGKRGGGGSGRGRGRGRGR